MAVESLRLVLGDPLSRGNPARSGLDPARDRVAMIEAPDESTQVRSHKARTVLFLTAMRHFAAALRAEGVPLDDVSLDDAGPPTLAGRLEALIDALHPRELVFCEPGEWRLLVALQDLAARHALPLELRRGQPRRVPEVRARRDPGARALRARRDSPASAGTRTRCGPPRRSAGTLCSRAA